MNSLGIDYKLLIAQVINFALFYWIFRKFIVKPFSNFLNIEINKEKEKQKVLDDLKKQEESMIQKEKEFNKKIKSDMDVALKEAKAAGLKQKDQILIQARNEADDIIARSKRQIDEERQTLHHDLKNRIADFSVLIVNQALKDLLTDEMRRNITNYILSNLAKRVDKEQF